MAQTDQIEFLVEVKNPHRARSVSPVMIRDRVKKLE